MPTSRRRHAVTETPPVKAALDELRSELGEDRVELSVLVILGASGRSSACARIAMTAPLDAAISRAAFAAERSSPIARPPTESATPAGRGGRDRAILLDNSASSHARTAHKVKALVHRG